jgi:hypothetical protein
MMRDLTGAPYAKFDDFHDLESLWQRLKAGIERNWIIQCSTASGAVREELKKSGVIGGQNYSILQAKEVVNSKGE